MSAELRDQGFGGSLFLMQANGGVASVDVTARLPVRALESGPAAGVNMAASFARSIGVEDILAFDMGGTTAKACAVEGGEPRMLTLFEVDQTLMRPGTGLPVMIPSVDLIEIGAGGGSLAQAAFGIVEVGPESAGADPGPVCYGLGGKQPAVTDANVALGYLNPGYFNGGQMSLDLDGAREAIRREVAEPLGLEEETAAWGVHEGVSSNMEHAMRAVTIERGQDPRGLMMVALGGSGPVHAARLARALGVRRLLLPRFAGVASAVGLLQSDPRFDQVHTWISLLDDQALVRLTEVFEELRVRVDELLDETGLEGERQYVRSVDMRYRGQGHVVEVPLSAGDGVDDVAHRFAERYAAMYGYSDDEAEPEITATRLSGRAAAPKLDIPQDPVEGSRQAEPSGRREVYLPEAGGFVSVDTYRRNDLSPGDRIVGPAIFDDRESTSVLLPGDVAAVDSFANLIVEIEAEKEGKGDE